jgi:hypothetical protein
MAQVARNAVGSRAAKKKKKGLRIAAQASDRITNIGRDGRI